MSPNFQMLGEFEVYAKQRERFLDGELRETWFKMYHPGIFDTDDLQMARNQASPQRYHFYEWLAAIQIFQSTGYLSLVEKYQFEPHVRKQEIFKQVTATQYDDFMTCKKKYGRQQFPDLLVYAPDYSDWYFCEVKGHTDKLSEKQEKFFAELVELSGKPIRLVKYRLKK